MNPRTDLIAVLEKCRTLEPEIARTGEALLACLKAGGKILTCGNGGSAADAMHLAEELLGLYDRPRRALPAVCLCGDATTLTCIANDHGYEKIFARQIEALGRPGDVLVGFTTSGNSPNVLAAFATARAQGVRTILLGGKGGGQARGRCDFELIVPADSTARIQEVHTLILHTWLGRIDAEFATPDSP